MYTNNKQCLCLLFPGLTSVLTKSISLDSNNLDSTTNEMYILTTPTRSSSILGLDKVRSSSQTKPLSRNIDTNPSDKIDGNKLRVSSHSLAQKQQLNRIVSLNQASNRINNNNNKKNDNNNLNKLRDDVIATASKEMVVYASNAVAAELKGAPSLIHDIDNNSNGSSIDGHFNHNTLDEYYKEPMYFGTQNSTEITTQIGANAHLPCTIHHIGEGVVSIQQHFFNFTSNCRNLYSVYRG